jgi:endonuclease-8
MPEGPSIVILREQVAAFTGRTILRAEGNAKIDMDRLAGKEVAAFRSWGEHFLIELPGVAVRVHFLMFGSYTINGRKPRDPRLSLGFDNGELNLYSCAVRTLDEELDAVYDWSVPCPAPARTSSDTRACSIAQRSIPRSIAATPRRPAPDGQHAHRGHSGSR